MIGDNLMADVLGGNNANIDTAWFNPHSQFNKTIAKPTYTIQNYADLLTILQIDLAFSLNKIIEHQSLSFFMKCNGFIEFRD